MYTKIINPETNRSVNINGKLGQKIINKYLRIIYGGASSDGGPEVELCKIINCDENGVDDDGNWRYVLAPDKIITNEVHSDGKFNNVLFFLNGNRISSECIQLTLREPVGEHPPLPLALLLQTEEVHQVAELHTLNIKEGEECVEMGISGKNMLNFIICYLHFINASYVILTDVSTFLNPLFNSGIEYIAHKFLQKENSGDIDTASGFPNYSGHSWYATFCFKPYDDIYDPVYINRKFTKELQDIKNFMTMSLNEFITAYSEEYKSEQINNITEQIERAEQKLKKYPDNVKRQRIINNLIGRRRESLDEFRTTDFCEYSNPDPLYKNILTLGDAVPSLTDEMAEEKKNRMLASFIMWRYDKIYNFARILILES